MTDHDWAEVVGAVGIFVFLISVVLMTIWQLGATKRTKAILGREEKYRTLAETSVRSQENVDRQLTEITGRLTEMRSRVNELERILKDVE